MAEKTVPGLKARDVGPVAEFYTALGFEITFQQTAPYQFLSVRRGGIELNFHGHRDFEPENSEHGCVVHTDRVDHLYAAFSAALEARFGTVPVAGVPRVGALKDMTYGVRQFLLVDPGGNTVQICQEISADQTHRPPPADAFARAVHMGSLFADSKQDLDLAVKVLDRALHRTDQQPTPMQLVQLLVLRADVAIRQGQRDVAATLLRRIDAVDLTAAQRRDLADELRRARELAAGR
ncbi:VOC family protein [Nocardia sp. NPDC005978]|uniref:VOC family protein n=1 Tax=Nocardia sp. NPDC005978 TaxID=3156725 RepID=UPI0033BF6EDA